MQLLVGRLTAGGEIRHGKPNLHAGKSLMKSFGNQASRHGYQTTRNRGPLSAPFDSRVESTWVIDTAAERLEINANPHMA